MAAGSRAASVSGSVKQQDSGSLPPHPLEGYGFPQIGAQQSVEAFDAYTDILAIWNSNFPTPQTNGGRVGGNTAPNRRPQRSRSQATVGRSRFVAAPGGGGADSGARSHCSALRRTAALMKGMEPGMRRDVSLPASLLPRDARQLAKSLRSPSPIVRCHLFACWAFRNAHPTCGVTFSCNYRRFGTRAVNCRPHVSLPAARRQRSTRCRRKTWATWMLV